MNHLPLDPSKALDKAIKGAGVKVPDTEMVWPKKSTKPVRRDSVSLAEAICGRILAPAPDLNWLLDLEEDLLDGLSRMAMTSTDDDLREAADNIKAKGPREERLCESIIAVLKERAK